MIMVDEKEVHYLFILCVSILIVQYYFFFVLWIEKYILEVCCLCYGCFARHGTQALPEYSFLCAQLGLKAPTLKDESNMSFERNRIYSKFFCFFQGRFPGFSFKVFFRVLFQSFFLGFFRFL